MKIKQSLLCLAVAMVPTLGIAAEYYVVPGLKASGNDGSSWDNALTMYDIFDNDALAKKIDTDSKYQTGDVFYLAGGTYYNATAAGADAGRIYRGYVFVGGCDPTKGAVTVRPTYPSATPTIFSGDLDMDGKPSVGDIRKLFHVRQAKEDDATNLEHICKIIGVDFTCSYSPDGSGSEAGAVFCTQGAIEMAYCNVYNNESAGEEGIAAGIHVYGGPFYVHDCNIYDNKCSKTGAGFRCSNRSTKIANGVIERCYFGNNEISNKFGGAIAYSSGTHLWVVNSTIVGNKAFYEGAGIVANESTFDSDIRALHIINSTIAGNTCSADPEELYSESDGVITNPGSWMGSQIRIASDPAVDICNSIIVGAVDDGTIAKAPIVLTGVAKDATKAYINSDGGSLLGTFAAVNPTLSISWNADYMNKDCNYEKVFGTEVAQINGGFTKTVKPKSTILDDLNTYARWGFELTEYLTNLKTKYGSIPFDIDLTVDQTGAKRSQSETAGDTAPGAYDFFAEHTGGVEGVISDTAVAAKLIALGNNLYQVEGVSETAKAMVYDIQGRLVLTTTNDIDINNLATGIYVISVEGNTFKVIK